MLLSFIPKIKNFFNYISFFFVKIKYLSKKNSLKKWGKTQKANFNFLYFYIKVDE
jgi:hypothetical protein